MEWARNVDKNRQQYGEVLKHFRGKELAWHATSTDCAKAIVDSGKILVSNSKRCNFHSSLSIALEAVSFFYFDCLDDNHIFHENACAQWVNTMGLNRSNIGDNWTISFGVSFDPQKFQPSSDFHDKGFGKNLKFVPFVEVHHLGNVELRDVQKIFAVCRRSGRVEKLSLRQNGNPRQWLEGLVLDSSDRLP